MLWRQAEWGYGQGPREELPAHPSASAPLLPSPADHVAQGHGGQKQAQDEHQLEEEGGARGSEPPRGRLGVPQKVVLGSKQKQWGLLASICRHPGVRPRDATLWGLGGQMQDVSSLQVPLRGALLPSSP